MPENLVMLALLIAATPIDIGRRVDVGQPFAVTQATATTLEGTGAARRATAEQVNSFTARAQDGLPGDLPQDLQDFVRAELAAQNSSQAAQAAADAKAVKEAAGAKAVQDAADAQGVAAAKTPAKAPKKA